MDAIMDAIKCVNCRDVFVSPVFLPCGHTICKKHTVDVKNALLLCHKCHTEHQIPASGSFAQIEALTKLIEAQIASIDLGKEHNDAKQTCLQLDKLLTTIEHILNDPFNFVCDAIDYLKNVVQLKGDQAKSEIDKKMSRIFRKLDEYKDESKNGFKKDEYVEKSKSFTLEKEMKSNELKKWQATLNEIKVNKKEWKRIKIECEKAIKSYEIGLTHFKAHLISFKKLNEFQAEIEQEFGTFELEPAFNLKCSMVLDSTIIVDLDLAVQLVNFCGFKYTQKFNLLYRGSLHGFKASYFHKKCDNIPKTLTIIKSTNGYIFGGYTEAIWDGNNSQFKSDKSAFLFSFVNWEKRPVRVNIANGEEANAIRCDPRYGPTFGAGHDICIADDSNSSFLCYSQFGHTYAHQDYPFGSEKAKCLLAGSHYFQVVELEVFQLE